MAAYLARRFVYAIITFFGITIATFTLIHSVPGDPLRFYLGKAGNTVPPEKLAAIRAAHHLDEPLPVQYALWLRDVVALDFGHSVIDPRPVTERIFEKLPNTIALNALAFAIAALFGVPLGVWSAIRSGSRREQASALGFFLLYSLPSFWVALLLMQFFAVRLEVLPLFGMTSTAHHELGFAARALDRLRHMVLPVITLSYAQLAVFARFSKAAVVEVLYLEFITTARAKGAAPRVVVWRHAFRNALLPLITLLGLVVPLLISGSVIVEQIFGWDGIGKLYIDAILARDYPVVMGLTVMTAVVTLFASVLADVLYAVADPRIRFGEESRR